MCLYPKLIKNRKYTATKKNGGNIPEVKDPRVLWIPVGCQKCMECRKQKARGWSVRLQEEIRTDKKGKFVTLTFSDQSIAELKKDIEEPLEGYTLDNAIATLGVRRFLERWRKKHKVSVKHWLITELGQGKNAKYKTTENLHLHGIIFGDKMEIIDKWKYGMVYIGEYVSEKTINYMTKYVTKPDELHENYMPKILTSAGIGNGYTTRWNAKQNEYKKNGQTSETYTTRQGIKINLPIYYRNKIYNEDQREKLWLEKLDKEERWVLGERISTKGGDNTNYYKALQWAQAKNKRLGYGDDTKDWKKIHYENQRRNLMIKKRVERYEKANQDNNRVNDNVVPMDMQDRRSDSHRKVREDFERYHKELEAEALRARRMG